MRWLDRLRMRLQMLVHRRREGTRLDAELEFHLEQQIAENVAAGMGADEARYAAMRNFGNSVAMREQVREAWSWNGLDRLGQDIRYATRQLVRAPGFAVTAILTLALGIGANTAIFTLTHALLLSSLPVRDPGQLVRLAMDFHMGTDRSRNEPLNLPFIEMTQQRARSFSGVFAWCVYDFVFRDGDVIGGRRGAIVGGNAFQVLGIHPAAGRLLTPADDQPGGGPDGWAAVISHRLWVEQYHADPAVIGRHIKVTGQGVTIVGVAPAGFEGVLVAEHPDLYLPMEFAAAIGRTEEQLHSGAGLWLDAFARLKPGVSRGEAQAEMNTLLPKMLDAVLPPAIRRLPQVQKTTLRVVSARSGWSPLRIEYTQPLLLLQLLVGAVLLICCANLSGLFLARASTRQQEFAIRGALGAGRRRLMRQMFVESLMLALPGALLGVGLAWLAGPWLLHAVRSNQSEVSLSVAPDSTVLAVTAACACLCALLFGMAPAWVAGHTNLETALRTGGQRAGGSSAGARRVFIPLQVALSLTLLVVATLLGMTVVRLRTQDTGFRAQNVIFYVADFGRLPQKGADLVTLYRRILARMEEKPGVEAASVVEIMPFYGWIYNDGFTTSADAQHSATKTADVNEIAADYFAAVGTHILEGRDLRNDNADLNSCVVNRSAADLYFPHASPLGQMLHQISHNLVTGVTTVRDCQIVGVVQDTKYDTLLESSPPIVYRPISKDTPGLPGLFFVLHARSLKEAMAAYHSAIHELAPASPYTDPATLEELMRDSMARQELLSVLSGFFAVLGLLLSGIGIYGLVAWSVTQRTREIGVRMALGASRTRVFLLVVRQIAVLLVVGIVAGGVGTFFAARAVRAFLYETRAENPGVFIVGAVALLLIGLLAAIMPARRAVSIDPMEALRTE